MWSGWRIRTLSSDNPAYNPFSYQNGNVPQAWAAGSIFHLLRAILGLEADAQKKTLYVDPVLPPWLPDITLHNLRVGACTLTLRFWTENNASRFEVLSANGEFHVTQRIGFEATNDTC